MVSTEVRMKASLATRKALMVSTLTAKMANNNQPIEFMAKNGRIMVRVLRRSLFRNRANGRQRGYVTLRERGRL